MAASEFPGGPYYKHRFLGPTQASLDHKLWEQGQGCVPLRELGITAAM